MLGVQCAACRRMTHNYRLRRRSMEGNSDKGRKSRLCARVQLHRDSQATANPSSSSQCGPESTSDCASSVSSLESGVFTISSPLQLDPSSAARVETLSYLRHSNLDAKPLTWRERFQLARVQYATVPNGFRLVAVVVCLAMFAYVTSTTLSSLSDVVVHLAYQLPNRTLPPAITICTHCVLCSFPDSAVRQISAWQLLYTNIEDLGSSGLLHKKDIIINCTLAPFGLAAGRPRYDCEHIAPPVASAEESRKCVTFFSDLKGETSRSVAQFPLLQLQFDNSPRILIEISGKYLATSTISTTGFENIRNVVDGNGATAEQNANTTGLYVALHDPKLLPYLQNMAVHQLMPGVQTVIPFVKRIVRIVQAAPFRAACRRYRLPEEPKGSSLPRGEYESRGQCLLHCLWEALNAAQPCSNFYSIFTAEMIAQKETEERARRLRSMITANGSVLNSSLDFDLSGLFKMCPKSERSFAQYLDAKVRCLKSCPTACYVQTFEDRNTQDGPIVSTERPINASQTSQIVVMWDHQQVVDIEHRPKWDLANLLGFLGGNLHVWLKVSVIYFLQSAIAFLRAWQLVPQRACSPLGALT